MNRLSAQTYNFILYSTIGMLFSEAAVFPVGFDFRLFYLIIMVNMVFLLCAWDFRLPKGYIGIITFMFLAGAASILRATVTAAAFFQQAIGITICSFYFYLFFSKRQEVSLERIFALYVTLAYWVTTLGIVQSAVITVLTGRFYPVQSVLTEPALFGQIVLPALYYCASEAIRNKRHRRRAVVLLLGVVLSGSSTVFFGLFVCGVLLARAKPLRTILVAVLLIAAGCGLYSLDDHFKVRIDDTIYSGSNGFDFSAANISTYAFLSNLYVAKRAFEDHPITGYGLGGHKFAHDKYSDELPQLGQVLLEFADINRADANSLFFRLTSETGLIGLALTAWFLVRFYAGSASRYGEINVAILTYFSPKLLRDGHWFPAGLYFFVWLYVLTSQDSKKVPITRLEIHSGPTTVGPVCETTPSFQTPSSPAPGAESGISC